MSDGLFDVSDVNPETHWCGRELVNGLCPFHEAIPVLPYAGTSGWSGSDTSKERAVRKDKNGTTGETQLAALRMLSLNGYHGITVAEFRDSSGLHHGMASGALSVLHKEGRIARLSESRNRCKVYCSLEYVNGRDTEPHGRKPRDSAPTAIDRPSHGTDVCDTPGCLNRITRDIDAGLCTECADALDE